MEIKYQSKIFFREKLRVWLEDFCSRNKYLYQEEFEKLRAKALFSFPLPMQDIDEKLNALLILQSLVIVKEKPTTDLKKIKKEADAALKKYGG